MSNEILNYLLKEYNQKKLNAEIDLEKRKENLYKLIPRLEEIDTELHSFAINTAKNILKNSHCSIQNFEEKIKILKKEKDKLLVENNYDLDYLKPFYECILCNDTGFITDVSFNTSMCSCLKQKLLDISINKSNMYNLKNQNFANFNELLFSDEVDFAKYKFNISPRRNMLNIKNNCIKFINNFDNPDYKNLLFVGSTGLR
ncbi:MAG: hypothetical protein HFJ59_03900 [Clostridia bacterium]|nr:hypothetical protein [Clostridia bacterium]